MNRSDELLKIRIKLSLNRGNETKIIEFQNTCLRPTLKFQNDILVIYFKKYSVEKKHPLDTLNDSNLIDFIRISLQRDQKLRNFYVGLITGVFTNKEFDFYIENEREIKKRIITMIIERLIDQLS